MKNLLIFLSILFSFTAAYSKDYEPIRLNDTAFFTGTYNNILAIRIDSSIQVGILTINHLNRTWNESDYNCIKPNGPSWLGYNYTENQDSYIFNNYFGDSIIIKPQTDLDSSWLMYNSSGYIIKAKVIDIREEFFLGLKDSIKYFLIEDQGLPSALNGKKFAISKNYGFYQIFNLNNFPDDTVKFTLSGLSAQNAGKTFLSPNEIFDYEIGDEFHLSEYYADVELNYTFNQINKVINKYFSKNLDTVYYQLDKVYSQKGNVWVDGIMQDINDFGEYTESEGHPIYKRKYLPYEPMLNDEDRYREFDISACDYSTSKMHNNRRIFNHADYNVKNFNNDSCWRSVIDDFGPGTFLEGCGFLHWRITNNFDTFENSKDLVYFKKGNETWGTPLKLISVEENPVKTILVLYPNPITKNDLLNIKSLLPITNIKIYNLLGILNSEFNITGSNEFIININDFESGVYLIVIKDLQNNIFTEKLIVQ